MFAILRKIYVDISTHVFPMLSGDLNLPDQTVELSDQIVKLLRHVVKHSDPYHITLLLLPGLLACYTSMFFHFSGRSVILFI